MPISKVLAQTKACWGKDSTVELPIDPQRKTKHAQNTAIENCDASLLAKTATGKLDLRRKFFEYYCQE